jgi:hypothetical protein
MECSQSFCEHHIACRAFSDVTRESIVEVIQPESYEIMKHLASRFTARMGPSVPDLCIPAHLLTCEGPQKILGREAGFSAPFTRHTTTGESGHNGITTSLEKWFSTNSPARTSSRSTISDSSSGSDEEQGTPLPDIDDDDNDTHDMQPGYSGLQVELFAAGVIESMLVHGLSADPIPRLEQCIRRMADNLGFEPETCLQRFCEWLSLDRESLPFLFGSSAELNPDDIWRRAHTYADSAAFAEVALRFVTLGTSETQVERAISVHGDISSLKGAQFSHPIIKARLQLRMSRERA